MAPSDRVVGHGCSVCNQSRRTSFFEQAIAFYLKSRLVVEQRAIVSKREIDIFLPDLKIGIEYDGAFYHSGEDAKRREERKNEALLSAGVRLIRVKESKDRECVAGDVIYHRANYKFQGVPYVMAQLSEKLSIACGEHITFDVDIARDKGEIVQSYEVDREENSLEALYPHVAAKWNYSKNEGMSPRMFTAKSGHRVWWKCPTCGNEWYGPIEHQVNGKCADNDFCPRCIRVKNKIMLKGGYSLKECFPDLAREWNTDKNGNLRPEDVTPGSKTVVWWHCSICGREWQSGIKARTVLGECGCRKCKLKAKAAIRKQLELKRTGGQRVFHVHSNSKPIIQFTRDGRYVARYKSLAEAIGRSGVSSLRKCLIGKQTQAGGFVWRYEDDIQNVEGKIDRHAKF